MENPEQELYQVMDEVSEDTGLDEFIMFGGAPVDLLSGFYSPEDVKDYDIAIQGQNEELMEGFEEELEENGYEILKSQRPFVIRESETVYTTYAENEDLILDANFMQDPTQVGVFNINSLYFTYPDFSKVDEHNALEGIENENLEPIIDLDEENAYLVGKRYAIISAKYGIPINNTRNRDLSRDIASRLEDAESTRGEFDEFFSSVLQSTLKTDDRVGHLDSLSRLGFLDQELEEIDRAYDNLVDENREEDIQQVESVNDLANLMLENMPETKRRSFYDKLEPLSERNWEEDPMRVDMDQIQI